MPTHDDVALFKDPYAVLSEISGQPSSGDAPKKQPAANRMSPEAPPVTDDNEDTFRDPFTTVPVAQPASKKDASAADRKAADAAEAASSAQMDQASKDNASSGKGEGKNDGKEGKAEQANAVAAPAPQALPPSPAPPAPSAAAAAKEAAPSPSAGTSLSKESPAKETAKNAALAKAQAAEAARAGEAEAATLRKEIAGLFGKPGTASPDMPNVEVKMTDEGVLISLTDEANYAMFSIGSAEPKSKTIEAMEKMAQLLKNRPGAIVVRGHTDGRPYKSGSYDNWQLSAARAQMAHYMLVRGGLDEKRIDRIEGYADHKLKVPADAMAAENRRIEILLRKDKQ
jgi:chemotaxis protein MotB